MTLPGETENTVAVYRIPLTESRAHGLADALAEYPQHELRIVDKFLIVDEVRLVNKWTAVRIGSRVAHALSGRTTNGNALTLCGLTVDHTNPNYSEIEPERVPIGQHCLRCW
jgi:hypothetical protein